MRYNHRYASLTIPYGWDHYKDGTNAIDMRLEHVKADATILAHNASVTVKQTFKVSLKSPSFRSKTKTVPLSYEFPIPTSAGVTDFKATINGTKTIVSECLPLDEGIEKFDKAVKETDYTAAIAVSSSPDIFKMSLGNLEFDSTVEIEVKYFSSLEYDTQYSGLRFSLPTSIFARYGKKPQENKAHTSSLPTTSVSANLPQNGIYLSVTYEDESKLDELKCVSHDKYSKDSNTITYATEEVAMQKEFVTISTLKPTGQLTATSVSTVNKSLSEEQTSVPALSNVLALTLTPTEIPALTAPSKKAKEIVFILDRSGSMTDAIKTLRNALRLFISSLPVTEQTYFNFISFGSDHSRMWQQSKLLTEESFEEAQKYVETIKADMGGTEIFNPVKDAVKNRLASNIELEVIVLTDGEVWDIDSIREFIKDTLQTPDSNARFFALGIGNSVSHALLDVIATEGHGFKQTVMEDEPMERKVIFILKLALAEPVKSVKVLWNQKADRPDPEFEVVGEPAEPLVFGAREAPSYSVKRASPYFYTPELGLYPVFAGLSSTMYVFYENEDMLLPYIKVQLTLGNEETIELEAPIFKVDKTSNSNITAAAAKRLLSGIKASNLVSDYDKKEVGTAVSLYFQVLSDWTSLVAVEKADKAAEPKYHQAPPEPEPVARSMPHARLGGGLLMGRARMASAMPPPALCMASAPMPAQAAPLKKKKTAPAPAAAPAAVTEVATFGSANTSQPPVDDDGTELPEPPQEETPVSDFDKLAVIVQHTKFDGSYRPSDRLLTTILTDAFKAQFQTLADAIDDVSKATADPGRLALAVLVFLRTQLADLKDSWEIMAGKTETYVNQHVDHKTLESF